MSNTNELCKGCTLFKGYDIDCCLIKVLPFKVVSNCPCSVCLIKPICKNRCDARITFFKGLRDEYHEELREEFVKQKTGKYLTHEFKNRRKMPRL